MPDGRPVHAHLATCGAQVLSLTPFTVNQEVTLGKEPHVYCARCFHDAGDTDDVQLGRDLKDVPVYDENGRRMPDAQESEMRTIRQIDKADLGRPTPDTRTGLGALEDRPYG